MAINGLINECQRALGNLQMAAQEAHDTAATDREGRLGLLNTGDIQTVAAGQEDILAMVEEVRQTLEEDKRRSDADQQALDRAADRWDTALNALQQLVSGYE